MCKKILTLLFVGLFLGMLCLGVLASQQERISAYHGADSVFKAEGITVIWGVIRGSDESNTMVYMKIIATEEAREHFKYYSVKATDAFSDAIQWLAKGKKLQAINMIEQTRELFQTLTERTILLYANVDPDNIENEKEGFSVYYLSLPDTTPEFETREKLEKYFIDAQARVENIETTIKTE